MVLKELIEWHSWLEQYLLQQGILMFDWNTYQEEKRKANEERLSKMTQEEQDEEFKEEMKQFFEEFEDLDDIDFEEDFDLH